MDDDDDDDDATMNTQWWRVVKHSKTPELIINRGFEPRTAKLGSENFK